MKTNGKNTAKPRDEGFSNGTLIGLSICGVLSLVAAVGLFVLRAPPFLTFSAPTLFAALFLAVWLAAAWREWRALGLAAVILLAWLRTLLDIGMALAFVPRTPSMELLGDMLLWACLPLALAAIANLWRIFENHAHVMQAQRAVRESEERFRLVVETAQDAVYAADRKRRLTLVNAGAARLFGRRKADLEGADVFDIIPEQARGELEAALERQQRNGVASFYHEFPIVRRDGTQRWVGQNVQLVMDGQNVQGFQAVLRDITERRTAEDALRESENRLRTLFDTMSEGVVHSDADGRILFVNPAAERILRVAGDAMLGKRFRDLDWTLCAADGTAVSPDEWPGTRCLAARRMIAPFVIGIRTSDDHLCWLHATAVPIPGDDGVRGVVVTFTDMSQTKEAEDMLHVIEYALDNAIEHVFLVAEDGAITYANRSALNAHGYTAQTIGAKRFFDLDRDTTPEDWRETWRRARDGERVTFESIHLANDGRTFPAVTSASHIKLNGREYLFAFVHDISREAELTLQLRQAQKMEAIGTLAGGIAHDFNNILSGIMGYTELALMEVDAASMAHRMMQEVQNGSTRAAALVNQILTFSRRNRQERQPLHMPPAVKEAVKLMRGSLPATIEIRQNIASDCMPVIADPTELHQVIVNLCTNAYHAMREKGGLLEVGLHDVNFSAQDVTPSLNLKPGRYVRLRVRDTGCGMDDATRRRMFEPFFTTKTEGEGTGLGLATVHGIVKGLHGAIEVSSAPGEGTCIEVYFPASMEPTEPPPARDAPPPSPEPGTERILVVDDEEAVARSTGMALERLGYRVTTCLDSVEAREAFEGDPHAFDLVITDQTMPEMTGFELASVMLGLRPELPVILRTGFDEMMSAQGVREVGIREMLKKPVSHQLLAATVRRLLDDTRA